MIEVEARAWFEMSKPEVHAWSYMDSMRSELRAGICNLLKQLATDPDSVNLLDTNEFWSVCRQENVVTALALDNSNILETKVVGMAMLFIHQKFSTKVGYIEDVVMDEDYRGQGIGKRLTEKLIEVAKHFKLPKIELTSNPNNKKRAAGIGMYMKMGFNLIAQSVDKDGTNLYRLVLS